jgi:hypothetical protein
MDVQVGDPVQRVAGSAPPTGPPSLGADSRAPHGELRLQLGWRWIPEADETDAPVPTAEDRSGLRAALIRALAWASLRT